MCDEIKKELNKLESSVNDILLKEIYLGVFQIEPSVKCFEELKDVFDKSESLADFIHFLINKKTAESASVLTKDLAGSFVENAYLGVLGRPADKLGLLRHTQDLIESENYPSLLKKFINSGEFLTSIMPNLFLNHPSHSKYVTDTDIEKVMDVRPHLGEAATTLMSVKRSLEFARNLDVGNKSQNYVVFTYRENNKKEYDTLLPVFTKLKNVESDINFLMMSLNEALMFMSVKSDKKFSFVVSIDVVAKALRIVDDNVKIIYMEHGVAPLKAYTYRPHYKMYDYSILPGDIWVNRIVSLYPELKGRVFSGGYAKLHKKTVTLKERVDYCRKLKLDPSKKIILFAPTWSGGDKRNGIFNVSYLKDVDNVIAIPHDGDVKRIKGISSGKVVFHKLKSESISYHYAFADLLVSDISSTAVEFARLGKPAICINSGVFSDYDHSFIDKEGIPCIPHTSSRWDFCPVVSPEKLKGAVERFLNGEKVKINDALVKGMCKSFGNESATYSADIILRLTSDIFGENV